MTKEDCISYIKNYLTLVSNKLLNVTPKSVVFIAEDNTSGFKFMDGLPMSFFPVATSTGGDVTLQAGTDDYLNIATNKWWMNQSGSWVSVTFDGTQGTLRRDSFVLAKNTGILYFYHRTGTFHPCNTTTEPTG